ncbi:MAG: hypothetical protein HC900_01540 [Methylacidiphilales bacterium]|nr:hypothetical protein [Candidatus Methylacidiphilales bacterium]
MAKLPALVSGIAKVDGRPREAVDHIARVIRERGYITTGKRGGGAAEMTPREAANLLIALNGADSAKEAPAAIDRFRSLRKLAPCNKENIDPDHYDLYPEAIKNVIDVDTFGEALDSLIENVPDLVSSFHQYFCETYQVSDDVFWDMIRGEAFGLDVTFMRYAVAIELYTRQRDGRRVEFSVTYMKDLERDASFYGLAWSDRRIEITIGMPTLIAAWRALHPGETLPGIPNGAFDSTAAA